MAVAQPTPEPGGAPQFLLHHRLALALEHGNVSRQEMGAHLGVGKNTVTNYVKGHTEPTVGFLRLWALRCGVPFDWLRTGHEESRPDDGTGQVIRPSKCQGGSAAQRAKTAWSEDAFADVA